MDDLASTEEEEDELEQSTGHMQRVVNIWDFAGNKYLTMFQFSIFI